MDYFSSWTEQDQIEFVEELLKSMQHHQHGTVNAFLKPMLQRDFISLLPKKVKYCCRNEYLRCSILIRIVAFSKGYINFSDLLKCTNIGHETVFL